MVSKSLSVKLTWLYILIVTLLGFRCEDLGLTVRYIIVDSFRFTVTSCLSVQLPIIGTFSLDRRLNGLSKLRSTLQTNVLSHLCAGTS